MIKNFGQFINEAKMPMVSKELMKATEKMHAEQLKQQELQKKFVSETDATKKEKMKADLIAQHKKVKEAERNFQEALGREHVDYDDELLESNRLNEKSGDAVKTVNDAINSGDYINNVSYEEYLLPLAEYLDSYADRHMGDLEFSKKTFTAFYNLVQSMNADMKEAEDYQ